MRFLTLNTSSKVESVYPDVVILKSIRGESRFNRRGTQTTTVNARVD